MERRRRERFPSEITLTCRVPATPYRTRLRDVSQEGCRFVIPDLKIVVGSSISFDLAGLPQVRGEVVWTDRNCAGVRFSRALSAPAAIRLGIEMPPEPVEEEKFEEPVQPVSLQGLLHHWIRRLTGTPA